MDCNNYSNPVAYSLGGNDTELIAFNFTATLPLADIWPSDGFTLKYSFTDYRSRKPTNGIYFVFLILRTNIEDYTPIDVGSCYEGSFRLGTLQIYPVHRIELDVSHCICNSHTCLDCEQHINPFDFVSEMAEDTEWSTLARIEWDFSWLHQYPFDVSIIPRTMTVGLQRCDISLFTASTKEKFDPIPMTFNLSTNCYTRIGAVYDIFIWLDIYMNIQNELIISINANHSKSCKLCAQRLNTSNYKDTIIRSDCIAVEHESFSIVYEYTFEDWNYKKNDDVTENIIIDAWSNSTDVYMSKVVKSVTSHFIKDELPSSGSGAGGSVVLIAVLLSVIIPMVGCICVYGGYRYVKYRDYMKAFVVDKALVLIIGVSQFDDKKLFLSGVGKNVYDLVNLWQHKYKYDVFVCNEDTLYSTKSDIIQFIDDHKVKLEDGHYQSVIVHVISHGSNKGDSFVSSDGKNVAFDGIRHELVDGIRQTLIKIMFKHVCRGDIKQKAGYRASNINHMEEESEPCEDSNWAMICGNIANYALSDNGDFTKCICEVFGNNTKKSTKKCFRELLTELGVGLQSLTGAEEICEVIVTLRELSIRFEASKDKARRIEKQRPSIAKKSQIDNSLLLSCNDDKDIINNTVPMINISQSNVASVKSQRLKPSILKS